MEPNFTGVGIQGLLLLGMTAIVVFVRLVVGRKITFELAEKILIGLLLAAACVLLYLY